MLLARLAVDKAHQKKGIGQSLLANAVLHTLEAAKHGGLRAMLVHAADEEAKRFYLKFDFEVSPNDPLHLFLLLQDMEYSFNVSSGV